MHVPELCRICRMGADITVQGHCAVVRGGTRLTGAEVMATDLRAPVPSREGVVQPENFGRKEEGLSATSSALPRDSSAEIARRLPASADPREHVEVEKVHAAEHDGHRADLHADRLEQHRDVGGP